MSESGGVQIADAAALRALVGPFGGRVRNVTPMLHIISGS